jgi:hypothetical protein
MPVEEPVRNAREFSLFLWSGEGKMFVVNSAVQISHLADRL